MGKGHGSAGRRSMALGMAPAHICPQEWISIFDGFSTGPYRVGLKPMTRCKQGLVVEGRIYKQANEVGTWSRKITIVHGQLIVKHVHMHLDPKEQGRGFASAFNAHCEEQYQEQGVGAVCLTTEKVGGYAWAQEYEFDPRCFSDHPLAERGICSAQDILRQGKQRVYERALPHVSVEEIQQFFARFTQNTPTGPVFSRPSEIAQYGRDRSWMEGSQHMWLGKALMLDSTWKGIKYLRSDASMFSPPLPKIRVLR